MDWSKVDRKSHAAEVDCNCNENYQQNVFKNKEGMRLIHKNYNLNLNYKPCSYDYS